MDSTVAEEMRDFCYSELSRRLQSPVISKCNSAEVVNVLHCALINVYILLLLLKLLILLNLNLGVFYMERTTCCPVKSYTFALLRSVFKRVVNS